MRPRRRQRPRRVGWSSGRGRRRRRGGKTPSGARWARARTSEATTAAGVGHTGDAKGVAFGDVNNDGWLDIYIGNNGQANVLYRNRGDGTFADCSDLSGCDDSNDGRGVIAADFDDDGDVDMFIHHTQRERHTLQRNELGDGGGFLKVRLRATSSQYEAIGAIVTVHGPHGPVADLMTRGAGFVSCQAPELVFGLGEAESARVEVQWVGGAKEDFGLIAAASRVLLVEVLGRVKG